MDQASKEETAAPSQSTAVMAEDNEVKAKASSDGKERSRSRSKGSGASRSRSRSKSRKKHKKSGKKKDKKKRKKRSRSRSRSRSSSRSKKMSRSRRSRSRSRSRSRKKSSRRSRSRSPGRQRGSSRTSSSRPRVFQSRRTKPSMWDVKPEDMPKQGFTSLLTASSAMNNIIQTRPARRIYLGGVDNTTEQEMHRWFQGVLEAGLNPADYKEYEDSIVSVYVNLEKHFAFVELNSVELATACVVLDGILFNGNPLRVKRPNDYNPATTPPPSKPIPVLNLDALGIPKQQHHQPQQNHQHQAHGVSSYITDTPNKLFVGGLPHHLDEGPVIELLEAFGKLKALKLIREPGQQQSRGYAFCEYLDPSVTDAAIKGLNGVAIGNRTLKLHRAAPLDQNHQQQQDNNNTPGTVETQQDKQHHDQQQVVEEETVSKLSGEELLKLSGLSKPPTQVLVLLNMVTRDELNDQEEYQDILDDISQECRKYGTVVNVKIPRPGEENGGDDDAVGKVFVEYGQVREAVEARSKLEGRTFGQQKVQCDYLELESFKSAKFS